MGVDVHQTAIHLAQGAVGVNGFDAGHDRLVVEDAAIHQNRILGVLPAFLVVVEVLRHET
ncbi:hypothetical protein D3C84_1144630 [compost metagenome]